MLRSLVVSSCLLLCACPQPTNTDGGTGGGFGGGSAAGGGTGTLTIDAYCSSVGQTICNFGTRCGFFETATGCASVVERGGGVADSCVDIRAAVNDGRTLYDGTRAAACLNATNTGCDALPTCDGLFTGTTPADGGCYSGEECAAGLYCALGNDCPGRCSPQRAEGQASGYNSSECLPGLYAAFGLPDGGFNGATCRRKATAGQACSGYGSCLEPLVCDDDTSVCVTAFANGTSCGMSDGGTRTGTICSGLLVCQPDGDGGQPTCAPVARRGETCGTCQGDLRCVTDGGALGRCDSLGTQGQSCRRDAECVSPLYCRAAGQPFGPGTCEPRGAVGASCNSDLSCMSGLSCVQEPPTDGGFFPEGRCRSVDAGVDMGCRDTTP